MNEEKAKYAINIKYYRGKRTQKEYAKDLSIDIRTIQNWENRGCSKTTFALLQTINLLEERIEQLEQTIKDDNMQFNLPK